MPPTPRIPLKPVQPKSVAPQSVAQQLAAAKAALDARNRAIQRPVNTAPPPNLSNLQTVAPKLAGMLMGNKPMATSPGVPYNGPITPNMVGTAQPGFIQTGQFGSQPIPLARDGVDQYGIPYDVPNFDRSSFEQEQAQRRAQEGLQGLGAAASRAAPKSNPMTGLGAFAANPNIAAANPFAGLGVTMGAQQVGQNAQPPYNPGLDDSRMGIGSTNQQSFDNSNNTMGQLFGNLGGQLFGSLGGQPQTQQSPYAPQQASNLMQNTGQFGQNVYGSFVGQQKPQQQPMQQQSMQQQNPAQSTTQISVAPPMQAGFNFFNQGQDQGNTGGGGAIGGGGLF